MVLSYGGWLIVLGIMGAANLIIAKLPQAKDLIGQMAPYQGWFGAVSCLYGFYELVQVVLGMGLMGASPPFGLIFWILFLLNGLLQISLGLLLGVGVMKTFIKQPQARIRRSRSSRLTRASLASSPSASVRGSW